MAPHFRAQFRILPRPARWLSLAALGASLFLSSVALAATHEVKPGDSLSVLAQRYGVSMDALMKANGIKDANSIRAGQKLQIPTTATGKESKDEPAAKPKPEVQKPEVQKPEVQKPEVQKPQAKTSNVDEVQAKAETKRPTADPEPETPKTKPAPPKTIAPPTRSQREAAEALYSKNTPSPAQSTLEERAPAWVLERPGPSTQVQKSNASRGGVFPCAAEDPGFRKYDKWQQIAPMAHALMPKDLRLDDKGGFDVMFHFHGREPIRKEWVTAIDNAVLIAVDVGIDSPSYATTFQDPRTFGQILRAAETEIGKRTGGTASVRNVGVSAWSAGYGAIEQLLVQPYPLEVIDSVVLLDGLHSGYTEHSLDATKLAPFVAFAERASRKETLMFVSHSSILPTGYASTTETAQYLAWRVGGKPQTSSTVASDPFGLERISSYSSGNFHVRGFRGNGAADHCAHIGLMSDVLRVHVAPRWQHSRPQNDAPGPTPAHDQPIASRTE